MGIGPGGECQEAHLQHVAWLCGEGVSLKAVNTICPGVFEECAVVCFFILYKIKGVFYVHF